MKATAAPHKAHDAQDLAKENAKLSKDVIKMEIDLGDQRKVEPRAPRGKWTSGKPGKLNGFKSSKDLQRSVHTKEISFSGLVAGDNMNMTSQDFDALQTVGEENNFDNYKAFPVKERLSKMKQTLQQRESVPIIESDLEDLKCNPESPVKRLTVNKTQDAKMQKFKREYKSIKDEERKSLIDYEREEQKKEKQTASVVNISVPEPASKPAAETNNAVVAGKSKKTTSTVNAKQNRANLPDEANSCVILPPHNSANVSNLDYLKKHRRKTRPNNSPVKRVKEDDESSLVIGPSRDKPEINALKPLPVKESTKYAYDASLSEWLAGLNLKDIERVKDIFFSNNVSLMKMPILTAKDLNRFGFKQSDPDFVKILRGLIELKEDYTKHPEKYKLSMQRSKEPKRTKKSTNTQRRLSNELQIEQDENSLQKKESTKDSSEVLLPRISNPQAASVDSNSELRLSDSNVSTSQHLPLERVGSGSLVNHNIEMQQMEESILNDMKPFENFPEDLNKSRELQNEEMEPTLQDIKEDALLSISFTEKQDEDVGNELENEELSSRKISNGMFGPLYNKDPAKLSKILSSDLARKDALTAVEHATKQWEKRKKEQEEELERAERLERQKRQERDRMAARYRRKTHQQIISSNVQQSDGEQQVQGNNAANASPERQTANVQTTINTLDLGAGDQDFELIGAKIRPQKTARGMMHPTPYKPPYAISQSSATSNQIGTKKKNNEDPLPTALELDETGTGLMLEGRAVANSPRMDVSKLQTQRVARGGEALDIELDKVSSTDRNNDNFSTVKKDLEQFLTQLEEDSNEAGVLETSALAREREAMRLSLLANKTPVPFDKANTVNSEMETEFVESHSNTPTMTMSENSMSIEDGRKNRNCSDYSETAENSSSNSNASTNSTHDLLQQLDIKLQVLKHSGSTPETLTMIEKIKQQLAQFELGMPTASTRMASSDQQTLPARLTGHSRARTVASAKMANHKNTPVREVEPMGSQLAPAKAANKAKTLMSLKASMAEQDMVKNLQKQQTQYKQQIRHLERELKRLKQNDVMSSCELNIEDLQFSEEDFLGDGAFADVFYGLYSGKGVAIKRLKGLLSSSDESYFNAEVSLLRELRHPNVVLLLGVCRDREGRPLMVLEYMENGSLFSVLHDFERSGLDHVAFYQISKDTVIGMNYLHKHKPGPVLHLDLKSMNVLLDEYGKAKIADFGFSKLKSNTDSGSENQLSVESRKGSPAWMAPETLQQGKVSTKSDVYSFGIILWEMLTREKPYEGMGLFQVMEGVAKKGLRPVIPGWVPKELTSLINLCWHAQPSQRPSFQEVLDILDNLHLPPEWKSLLDAAGVPRIVLEDPEVTRSIVEFVHLSLNVSDSSSSIPTSGGGLSESMIDQERQMIDLEVVSAFEMLTRKQKEKSYRTLVPALSSLASSVGDDRDRSDVNNDISDVWDIQVHSTPVAEDSDTPRALSQMEKSKEDLKITELYTHESRPRTVIGSSAEPIRSQISEDVLRNQKAKLRPTTVAPHPSQLANLASVDEGKLNTIAAVIKQALNDRREFMLDDTSSERGEDDRSSMMGGDTTRRTDDDVTRNK